MDILPADKTKNQIRLAAWWLRHKYAGGANKDKIHDDMLNCGNPVLRKIFYKINELADIKEGYQRSMIVDFVELFLWILYKDTAYRDPFFYIAKNIFDIKDELMPDIMKYYKEPKDFYVNRWHDTKENTKKGRENKSVLSDELSYDETFFVGETQRARRDVILDNMNKDIVKEVKKRRGY